MHHHRRRKKRPNYGSIEVSRGEHGFGFTISGQQPCILSCIVPNSPADLAGLRSGDFLISVNGLNVSKLPHESVVQLIGSSSLGTIRLAIAENYYSDSSDDDGLANQIQRARPKFPHHKLKINRNVHNRLSLDGKKVNTQANEPKPSTSFAVDQKLNQSSEAVNKATNASVSPKDDMPFNMEACRTQRSLEYRIQYNTFVGYLGTIEMPKQIATSSKLQTVRSCIRKIRQEKRNPTMVLMTILPHCLTLRNNLNVMLAKYPNSRLSFVSGNSENDKRFFGLVTSAMYSDGMMCENGQSADSNIIISNSCHVFVVDTKLTEHSAHLQKAEEFRITCTKDPISDLCLEFPNNSEYVVNLIRSMYTLKSVYPNENERPHVARQLNMNESPRRVYGVDEAVGLVANSPQPSNHSEITTTSSNSDSGIGFHNDCANISDRILVVDFPGLQNRQIANIRGNLRQPSRPVAIINDHSLLSGNIRTQGDISEPPVVSLRSKSKSMDLINHSSPSKFITSRQNRAIFASNIPGCSKDVKSPSQLHRKYEYEESPSRSAHDTNQLFQERPVDVPQRFKFDTPYNLRSSQLAARSCDDVMMTYRTGASKQKNNDIQLSIDDVSLLGAAPKPPNKSKDDYVFLPPKPVRKSKKPSSYKHLKSSPSNKCQSKSVTASPNSLRLCRPVSASVENLLSNKQQCRDKSDYESIWGSMQDLRQAALESRSASTYMEGTYSEPDLTVSFFFLEILLKLLSM